MATAALGYGIVCAAIVAFVCRLELRQRRLRAQYDTLSKALESIDASGEDSTEASRAA